MTKVKLISTHGKVAVVEWLDTNGVVRSMVPIDSLVESEYGVFHPNPQMGMPYGVAWESVDIQPVTSSALAQGLRSHGIFTLADLQSNLDTARGVLLGLLNVNVNKLVQFGISAEKHNE